MGLNGSNVTQSSGMLTLDEMSVGLGRIPRFAGQTVLLWTVADHLNVAKRMARALFPGWGTELLLHIALHDAHEAVTGDVPTSHKTEDFRKMQDEVLDPRVYASLGLSGPSSMERHIIKVIDEEALLAEAAVVCPSWTYLKIVEERGHLSSLVCSDIVRDYLHEDNNASEEWLDWVTNAVAAVKLDALAKEKK